MIIDYDDMLAAGMVKEASDFLADNANAAYAIFLNTPSGTVGKFRITTPADISNSIEAINKNASIPAYIKRPAMHYIHKAACDNGIDTGWDCIPLAYSRYVDFRPPTVAEEPLYVLKVAGQYDIAITSERELRTAFNMFKTAKFAFPPKERIAVASELLKTAAALGAACDPDVSAYAYADYSPRTNMLLENRRRMTDDEDVAAKYGLLKQAYDQLGTELPPDIFLSALEGIDKQADIHSDVLEFFRQ